MKAKEKVSDPKREKGDKSFVIFKPKGQMYLCYS